MPQRNVATNFTFEQQRVEINELAADFWTQKGTVDTAAGTYLLKDGTNAFTGANLAVPNAFTINSNSGAGTVTIAGNLQVDGTTTTLNTATLEIADKNLVIAKGGANDAAVDGAGITIDSSTDITWNFVDADDAWVSSIGVKAVGGFTGNLTGNVTGNADTATSATTAGTVTTAAQPNITSVGTLTSLTTSGLLTVQNTAPKIKLIDSDATGTPEAMLDGSGGDLFLWVDKDDEKATSLFGIKIDGAERLRITSDGQLLHTANKASGYTARFDQANAANPGWIEINSPADDNVRPAYLQLQNAGTDRWGIGQVYASTSSKAFHLCAGAQTEANSKFTLTTDGKVGIGTVNPGQLLEINGASSPCVLLKDTTNNVISYLFADDSNAYVGSASDHPVVIQQNNGPALTITTGKQILIGTSTSNTSDRFTIVDPGNAFMSLRSDQQADGNSQIIDFAVGTGNRASGNLVSTITSAIPNGATAGGTLKGYLAFSTNSGDNLTERMRINEDGHVFIKHSTTNAKIVLSRNVSVGTNDTSTGVIDFANNTAHTVNSRIMGKTSGTGNVGGQIVVETRDEANSVLAERLRIKSNGDIISTGDISDSKVSLRTLPRNEKSAAYTVVTADKGKFISTNSNVTFDNTATWNTGDVVTVYNWGASAITIVDGTGFLMHYTDGTTASTGDRILASRGLCTLLCVEGSNNTFVISGALT